MPCVKSTLRERHLVFLAFPVHTGDKMFYTKNLNVAQQTFRVFANPTVFTTKTIKNAASTARHLPPSV